MMNIEYINPFVGAAFGVMGTLLGQKATKGQLAMRLSVFTSQQCNIITGVAGKIEGQVIYGMSLLTADKIASYMIGQPIRTFDQLAASAIAELGNMITVHALADLAEAGFICDITPTSIIRGTNAKISPLNIPALVVPICLEHGEIEMIISLRGT